MSLNKTQIAQRIAQELEHNTYVNLGIGITTEGYISACMYITS